MGIFGSVYGSGLLAADERGYFGFSFGSSHKPVSNILGKATFFSCESNTNFGFWLVWVMA